MNKSNVRILAINAMIACLYAVLTILIAPLAYGAIQFRFTEIIVLLAFYNKKYIPGLTIGCFLANLASPLGAWDLCFGTLATFLACVAMYYSPNLMIAALCGGIFNGIIVGLELSLCFEIPFLINALYVFAGEIAVLIIGVIIFKFIEKNDRVMQNYISE